MNSNEYMRIWRANNKDKIKAINKKWWLENREFLKLKRQIIKNETVPAPRKINKRNFTSP